MIITVFICCRARTSGSSLATPGDIVCRLCAGLPQADVHVLSCGLLLFWFINCYSLTYQSRLRRRLFLFVDAFACSNVCLGLVSCFGRCPLVVFLSLQVSRWLVCAYMLRSLLVLQLQLLTGFQRLALEASFGPGLYIRSLTVIGKSPLYV